MNRSLVQFFPPTKEKKKKEEETGYNFKPIKIFDCLSEVYSFTGWIDHFDTILMKHYKSAINNSTN